ncbi:glycosyl hydrolase 115 family protein [Roseateles sp. LKC17W]|uniref:Glycosyl hydrolase 115 family protein n=1 Tax=Pelomonas margarita TaxID=3299031 RepID=A0ABW7FPM4_9BURK
MNQHKIPTLRRDHVGTAVSFALALLAHEAVTAQTPTAPASAASAPAVAKPAEVPKAKAPVNELETVLIVGTRQSQQSAISRKKGGATAQDSIVAEDVGAFPDRNVGEAISRIAGVALERGDFGEGVSVSIRGNGPELTRVEIDGMGVRSGAGTDLNGGGDGRGTEFRELSADLIKSVDVVKGSTADMTEGSLGGGVIIQTRTGLDFPKPFYSLRVAGTQSSLNKETTPNLNLVLADKFLDKRLGVIVNLNRSELMNERHRMGQGGSNNEFGLIHTVDLDNSPEKTFIHNPKTLAGESINLPLTASRLTAGGFFNSATPTELLTKSAAAQSKADCFTSFPTLTTAQSNTILSADRNAAYTARQNEQLTCLNQWNDYMPSSSGGFRYDLTSQRDRRSGGDIRLDFKVNDQLSIYGKYAASKRHVDDTIGFLGLGSTPEVNVTGTFADNTTTHVRSLAPGVVGYTIRANKEKAHDYAIVMGTSHAEPMSRNNTREWNDGQRGELNYFVNKPGIVKYWAERADEIKAFENVYTLGLRGKRDSGMFGVTSKEQARDAMLEIFDIQRGLLSKAQNKPAHKIPQVLTLYKEVLDIYALGLKVPDDVTLVWPEDNYGYINQLSTPQEQARAGGAGVYYHVSYLGRPHDYIWLGTTHFETFGRSDEWKQNVLSNSAVRDLRLSQLKAGAHRVEVYALDPGFVLDRLDLRLDGAPDLYGAPLRR